MPTARTPSPTLLPAIAPVVVLAVGAVGVFLLRPPFAEFVRVRTASVAHTTTLAVAAETRRRADAARATFETLTAEDLAVVDAVAPPGEDVPGLFTTIDGAAQRAGVVVASIEVTRDDPATAPSSASGAKVLAVGASIRNVDYPRLKAFLDVLASSRRLLDVTSVQFTPTSRTATLRLRAYTNE